jgi:hypothetical protein
MKISIKIHTYKEALKFMEQAKTRPISTVFGMMISPGPTVKKALSGRQWYLGLIVSTLAFALFFLQTGLDLYKTGQKGFSFVALSAATGAVYGLLVIPALGVLVWSVLKVAKTDKSLKWAISSFCLSYSGALIYGLIGVAFSLILGWKTSMAFGVTGVLWAIGPMMVGLREMSGGKTVLGVILATLVGSFVLLSWALLGNY